MQMKKEHAGLRRRPLLTPVWLSVAAAVLLVAAVAVFLGSMTTTTLIVVRHAEKELGTIEDPPLSPAGEQRAQLLARMLGNVSGPGRVAAIFASDTRRAQRTVAPLATRLGLTVNVLPARDIDGLLNRIRDDHRGRTVLVAGHSNTVPELVRRFARAEAIPDMPESEYGTLYVVTVPTLGRPSIVRLSY